MQVFLSSFRTICNRSTTFSEKLFQKVLTNDKNCGILYVLHRRRLLQYQDCPAGLNIFNQIFFAGSPACGISRLHRKYRPYAWFRYFFCERLFAVLSPAIRETEALREAVRLFSEHRKGIAARCCHRVWQAIPFPCVLFGRLGLYRPYNPAVSPRISYIPHQKNKGE